MSSSSSSTYSSRQVVNIPVSKDSKSIVSQTADLTKAPKKQKFKRRYITDEIDKYPIIGDQKNLKRFIVKLLTERGGVIESQAIAYLDGNGLALITKAVTHDSVSPLDETDNYELLEHLGDSTVNKCTTWYLSRRFPNVSQKGKIAASIFTLQKNMLANKVYLSKFCEKIQLDKYILYRKIPYVDSKTQGKSAENKYVEIDIGVQEDVFEALFAAIEMMIDNAEQIIGLGYAICYKILASIYDDENIPFTKDDLVDNKTKFKEIFDKRKDDTYRYNYNEEKKEVWLDLYMKGYPHARAGPISTFISKANTDDSNKMAAEQLLAYSTLIWLKQNFGIQRFTEAE